jgi:TIM-barrel protein
LNVGELLHRIAGKKVPIFLAAMAGITDPSYSLKAARTGFLAGVSIGGYDIDNFTHEASLEISNRRKEFTIQPEKLFEEIETGLLSILSRVSCFINLRAIDGQFLPIFCEKVKEATRDLQWQPIVELNVHCVQPEMLQRGAGLALSQNWKKIASLLKMVKDSDLLSGMKFKIINSPDDPFESDVFITFLKFLRNNGLDILHLDAYEKWKPGNYNLPITVAAKNIPELLIIGNNSIMNADDGKEMIIAGAHGFSVARGYLKYKSIFKRITSDFKRF